jgi:hypothetical protein
MTAMFEDLMNRLNEVDAFLAGQTSDYKVSVPADVAGVGLLAAR